MNKQILNGVTLRQLFTACLFLCGAATLNATSAQKTELDANNKTVSSSNATLSTDSVKSGSKICEVPNVSNEELFKTIAQKYKGKVVLVDLWATWCGPCRVSIKEMEPKKDDKLKHDDLAFVYLTGESSPIDTWNTMIKDIRGDHYRVSKEQWGHICSQFAIDGIPSYIVIQRDGTYKLRNDLRNHELMMSTLLETLEESKK